MEKRRSLVLQLPPGPHHRGVLWGDPDQRARRLEVENTLPSINFYLRQVNGEKLNERLEAQDMEKRGHVEL